MIELYTAGTANGRRPLLLLEELGLAYTLHQVDFRKGEHRSAAFLRLNPRGQIPVIVDEEEGAEGARLVLAQSYAILLHYALKFGRFLPVEAEARALTFQWLSQVASDTAPASSTLFAVQNFVPEKVESTADFFTDRLMAHFRFLDQRLEKSEYLAGDTLSIADLALYPVYAVRQSLIEGDGGLKSLERWGAALAARPAIARAMALLR